MSRSIRALIVMVVVSFAFSAAACTGSFGPRAAQCDTSNSNTCH